MGYIGMTLPWSTVELISADHHCDSFTSGVESGIDDWFRRSALNEQRNRRMSTWVCLDNNAKVIAFFSLCTIACDLRDASKSHQKSLCTQGTTMAPATLLAKMGLSSEFHRRGLGRALVLEAFRQATTAADRVACRLLVVDALTDDLVPFYERMFFTKIGQQRRLMMKMSKAREIITAVDGSN